ncbi:MAG TPA: hypothetical protein VGL91_24905 [Acidobacteriota bacterium]|jgi:hypothetical protein
MDVIKKLARLAAQYTIDCCRVLQLLIQDSKDEWLLVGVETEVDEILRTALQSPDAGTAQLGARIVEDLIARGHFGFRRLLSRH